MIDIHCHILPGVDDGARDIDESISMLMAAQEAGIDHVICTPHCRWDNFSFAHVRSAYMQLLPHAVQMGMRIDLGYEVYWRKLAEIGIKNAPMLTVKGTNLLLLEMSSQALPARWQHLVYELQYMGLQPIIAHPERYKPVQRNIDVAQKMRETGCLLQVSANFVHGGPFDTRRQTAIKLLKKGLVEYIASDAHRPEDYIYLEKALNIARRV